MPPVVDRVGPNDLMQMALDVGPSPMHIGAILVLDRLVETAAVCAAIGERTTGIPRMRQRLLRLPWGCGGPVWADDARFDVRRHVNTISCAPGEGALLAEAVRWYTRPLPPDRPLWRATILTGLGGGRSAVVLTVHHVLADGIGGLALLGGLVDGASAPAPRPARTLPPRRTLAAEAWRGRLHALARMPGALRALRPARRELGGAPRATRCSLNQPLHPGLRVALTRTDLTRLHATARAQGATVNDAVLEAVTGALGELLARRGEQVAQLVVSVPVTGRVAPVDDDPSPTDVGRGERRVENRVGVMPVTLPTGGSERLQRIAQITRARKGAARGSSTSLTRPAFRLLGALGVLGWLFRRQRMVNTFVTNVRGPDRKVEFLGAEVSEVLPLGIVSGNVTVAFTVLSYAGTLIVAIAADPVGCPDLDALQGLLQHRLDNL